jgi:hypothetical protein
LVLMDAATVFIDSSSSSSSLFHCIFKIRLIPTRTIQQYMSQHFWFQQMRCILTIQHYCHHPWCCESNNIDLTSAHNTLNHSIKENPTISIAYPFLMNAFPLCIQNSSHSKILYSAIYDSALLSPANLIHHSNRSTILSSSMMSRIQQYRSDRCSQYIEP